MIFRGQHFINGFCQLKHHILIIKDIKVEGRVEKPPKQPLEKLKKCCFLLFVFLSRNT